VRLSERGSPALQRALVVILALALGGAGVLFAARAFSDHTTSSHAPAPVSAVANGLIAFSCGYHVCSVMPDGSAFTDLIKPYDPNLVLAAYSPVFSPEGDKIAFRGYTKAGGHTSTGGANYDLFVMNADGSGLANLTKSPEDVETGFGQSFAQWSPDGSMIAYEGDDGLYVMNADEAPISASSPPAPTRPVHQMAPGSPSRWDAIMGPICGRSIPTGLVLRN
jgi:WD40-like Beta Propeller Repeat